MENETILPPTWPIIVLSIICFLFHWTFKPVYLYSDFYFFFFFDMSVPWSYGHFLFSFLWILFPICLRPFLFLPFLLSFFLHGDDRAKHKRLPPPTRIITFFLFSSFFFFLLLGLLNGWVVGFSWSDVHPPFPFPLPYFLSLSFTFWPSLVHLSVLLFIFCTDVWSVERHLWVSWMLNIVLGIGVLCL